MNGAQNLTEPVAAQAGPDASPRNRRDWTYFDERLSELRKNDVENIIARGRILIEANDELERGSYEATVKRHFDLSYARKLRIIAAHPVISNRAHVHALPPSVFTLYELTKLPAALLRETLNDGSINAKLERKDVAAWRAEQRGKVEVDGKTIERKSLREQLKAAGGGYFDLALDSAEHIGQQLAEHMSEARFDTAVKAAKARFKAKRQKPAG